MFQFLRLLLAASILLLSPWSGGHLSAQEQLQPTVQDGAKTAANVHLSRGYDMAARADFEQHRLAPFAIERIDAAEAEQTYHARLNYGSAGGLPHAGGMAAQGGAALMETKARAPILLDMPKVQGAGQSIARDRSASVIVVIFCSAAVFLVTLAVCAAMHRRITTRLRDTLASQQMLISGFNQADAAVAIFDGDMGAVCWSGGLEDQFPRLVPLLKSGCTLDQCCSKAFSNGDLDLEIASEDITVFTKTIPERLRAGERVQQLLQTRDGRSCDLRMFRLGRHHYAAVWFDVSKLHHQNKQLGDQQRELVRANQQLLAFSAMAAHDLKAPLVQQSVLMEFILEDVAEIGIDLPVTLQNHFCILNDLSRKMNVLVGDLLDYAKAKSDCGDPQCFAPNERFDGVLKLAAQRPCMVIEIEPDMPDVEVDPTSFDLVMRNLISNAVKHHDRAGGKIKLRAYRTENEVTIEVEDDGPGIAPAQRSQVFEPFARLTRVEGSGLGLALVRKTVTAWGGSISLRAAPQRGCIFSITLPAAAAQLRKMPTASYGRSGGHSQYALGLA